MATDATRSPRHIPYAWVAVAGCSKAKHPRAAIFARIALDFRAPSRSQSPKITVLPNWLWSKHFVRQATLQKSSNQGNPLMARNGKLTSCAPLWEKPSHSRCSYHSRHFKNIVVGHSDMPLRASLQFGW